MHLGKRVSKRQFPRWTILWQSSGSDKSTASLVAKGEDVDAVERRSAKLQLESAVGALIPCHCYPRALAPNFHRIEGYYFMQRQSEAVNLGWGSARRGEAD